MSVISPTAAAAQRVRGFVDIRAFAARGMQLPWMPMGHDPYLANRRILDLPQGEVSVAVVDLQPGGGRGLTLPGDEFILVLEGSLAIAQGGATLGLDTRDCAVVPRAIALDWSSETGAMLIVMRCIGGGGAGASRPVKIDPHAALDPSGPPAAELLVGPVPSCRNHTDYRSASGEFACGTWASTAYHRRPMRFRHYELMHLLEGSVEFVDASGRKGSFHEGDIVLFEQGGECSWESRVDVKKVYASYRPA